MKSVGIDVGGSYIKIVDSDFNRWKERSPEDFDSLINFVKKLSRAYDTVGVAIAGFVDLEGNIHKSPNIPYLDGKNIAVDDKVVFGNDATLACYGEVIFGAGRSWRYKGIVVCITLGTGLGGGLVIDGSPFWGSTGVSMEIGHMRISEQRICRCGRVGCAEEFVSSRAIVRYFEELTGRQLSAEEIVDLANSGDKFALEAMRNFAFFASRVIQNISHILNPSALIISGGIIYHFSEILNFIDDFSRKVVIEPIYNSMKILKAELGEFSGAYGALALAMESQKGAEFRK